MEQRKLDNEMDETRVMPVVVPRNSNENFQEKAKRIVISVIDSSYNEPPAYEVYVVWFCKALQNWKALVVTTLEDHQYYEVTYNGDLKETYVDTYVKVDNQCIFDES